MAITGRVTVGGEEIRIEPFSGRKALRVLHTVNHIATGVPEILERWATFTHDYEQTNAITIDRASARRQFAPMPLYDEEPVLEDGKPVTTAEGDVLVRRVARTRQDGTAIMGPDPLGHMSDADWEASGNMLRLPRSPTREEQIVAIFPQALELAEEETVALLALIAMSNADLKRFARQGHEALRDELKSRGEDLLDADLGELVELAIVAGEAVNEQYQAKARELGGRLGNALKLFGISLPSSETTTETETSKETSSTPSPSSSTDSPVPTDGERDEPSTEPAGLVSSPSSDG
jgi:hypothetical protein